MKSLSKILKSSQVIIDENLYEFTPSNISNKDLENYSSDNKDDTVNEIEVYRKKIIDKAKEEAEDIIRGALEKSTNIMEQARKEAYEIGKKEGFQEGKRLADSIIQEALNIKNEVIQTKQNLIKDLEEEIIELVIKTIEKILNKKIEEDYEILFNIIDTGLKKCAFTDNLTLRISPEDYDLAISSKDKILALSENIEDIVIKQDKSLHKGSCIIDTSSGSIDSSIWTQFNQVKEIFEELLKNE